MISKHSCCFPKNKTKLDKTIKAFNKYKTIYTHPSTHKQLNSVFTHYTPLVKNTASISDSLMNGFLKFL